MRIRCPHCHQHVEVLEDDPLVEVDCPSCGSRFNLVARPGELSGTIDHVANGSAELSPQRRIGHFELIEELGRGAFGSVWKAHDTELDRFVAVKLPRREQLTDDEVEQFLREARAAAQLQHPNLVSVHEVGREEGQVYIVSDFIEGASLLDWIEGQVLTAQEATKLCIKIAEALEHAHQSGVVHRDLKPSNIMMALNGEPHIMDFGLAKREAGEITMTVEGRVLGTPAYMPPEQARGEGHNADARSDVYSLGVILFQLITGELPFRGDPRMLVVQILKDDPPSPRKLNGAVPRDLETICLKCLEKEREGRYQSAANLVAELKRFQKNKPIQARPIGRTERLWRWCRRNPTLAWLTASVMATLVIGTIVSSGFAAWALYEKVEADRARTQKEEELLRAETLIYISQFRQAHEHFLDHDVLRCELALEECRQDLRGSEYGYLNNQLSRRRTLLRHDSGAVLALALSRDGKRLFSGGEDNSIKVWDLDTGRELFTLRGHSNWVRSLVVSPNGNHLFSGGPDKTTKIWDLETQEDVFTFRGHAHWVWTLALSPDGKRLFSGSRDNTIKVWDVETREEMFAPITPSG